MIGTNSNLKRWPSTLISILLLASPSLLRADELPGVGWAQSPLAKHLLMRTQEGHRLMRESVGLDFGTAPSLQKFQDYVRAVSKNPQLLQSVTERLGLAEARLQRSQISVSPELLESGNFGNSRQHVHTQLYLKHLARAYLRNPSAANNLRLVELDAFESSQLIANDSSTSAGVGQPFLNKSLCASKLMPGNRFAVPGARSGSIATRIKSFANRHPDQVSIVQPGMKFMMNSYTPVGTSRNVTMDPPLIAIRPIVAISLAGMDTTAQTALFEDWLQTIANGTTSYPMSSSGSILYRRVGNQVFSYRANSSPYSIIGGSNYRMEPIVTLDALEEFDWLNHHEFAAELNGTQHQRFRMDFDGSEDNCTSPGLFFTMATGRPFYELLGQKRVWDCADNPGWALYSMLAAASEARIPYVAVWSRDRNLQRLIDEIRSNRVIDQWNFGKH